MQHGSAASQLKHVCCGMACFQCPRCAATPLRTTGTVVSKHMVKAAALTGRGRPAEQSPRRRRCPRRAAPHCSAHGGSNLAACNSQSVQRSGAAGSRVQMQPMNPRGAALLAGSVKPAITAHLHIDGVRGSGGQPAGARHLNGRQRQCKRSVKRAAIPGRFGTCLGDRQLMPRQVQPPSARQTGVQPASTRCGGRAAPARLRWWEAERACARRSLPVRDTLPSTLRVKNGSNPRATQPTFSMSFLAS